MVSQKTTLADHWTLFRFKTINYWHILRMVTRRGLFATIRDVKKRPWILVLLKINKLLEKLAHGRSGRYRIAQALVIANITTGLIELLEDNFYHNDRLVLHEDMVPPEILYAMGLKSWLIEGMGILLPMLEPTQCEQYIDSSEVLGVPVDTCSLPKAALGMAKQGQLPKGVAMITSNLPCDGGKSSYEMIKQHMQLPLFSLDIPYQIGSEESLEYLASQLAEMISWLEENTPGRMNWERLREVCELRNATVGHEMDIWDMLGQKPAPMAAEITYLAHMWTYNFMPGKQSQVRLMEQLSRLCQENLEEGTGALKEERYRALLWNPIPHYAAGIFVWAEQTYGVSVVMDGMSFNRQPFINTDSPEEMLKGLGQKICDGPMARHSHGPVEKFFDELFYAHKTYNTDMIWIADNIACKPFKGFYGILREKCREKNIPLLIFDHGLLDSRVVDADSMLRQIDDFMQNRMNATKLVDDSSLL
jgi:benzoyl-CoA reductase/2-hydroxyglutaryl-CoA dehydratase subunit BcrC/BadD/HgdB